MAMTPEGRIKKLVKALLDSYAGLYQYWPVPAGMGPSSLDCLVCFRGRFIGIETKAPGKKPTARQEFCIQQMHTAGGITFVIDGAEGVEELKECLEALRQCRPSSLPPSQPSSAPSTS